MLYKPWAKTRQKPDGHAQWQMPRGSFKSPTLISMADQPSSTAAKKKGADMVKGQFQVRHPKSINDLDSASQPKFPVAMAEVTLTNICLDVQIGICMFLYPSDILALRKVCRHWKFSLLKSVMHYYQDL